MIPIKTEHEIALMRESAKLLVKTFKVVEEYLETGIQTKMIDKMAEEVIRAGGAVPSFKGYHGYPASTCISIDKEVVHGIPDSRELGEDEIISIDIGVLLNGYHSDAAKSYLIGESKQHRKDLLKHTRQALHCGIRKCRSGNRLGDISHAIQTYAESKGYSIVRSLVGHGIGQEMHEEPQIPNYGPPRRGPKLKAGMVFAIEPMINMGLSDVFVADDGWTVETRDGKPSAHFEHTVVVTSGKPEILTIDIENNEIGEEDE